MQQLATPHQTIVCTQGIHASGEWILWGTAFRTLIRAEVKPATETQPLMLELAISNGQNVEVKQILVPAGQEQLGQQVIDRIIAAPTAREGGTGNMIVLAIRTVCAILQLFA